MIPNNWWFFSASGFHGRYFVTGKEYCENPTGQKWNEKEKKWYFSVQDVVEILTDSSDVKQYIKKMLSRDEPLKSNWGTICTLVEMEAADGKRRKIKQPTQRGF